MKESSSSRSVLARAIRDLRKKKLGHSQDSFAGLLGVSLSTIAKWETDQAVPSNMAIKAINQLVPSADRGWWERATEGVQAVNSTLGTFPVTPSARIIRLYRDQRNVGEMGTQAADVERVLSLPENWFPEGGLIEAARITDTSLAPLGSGSVIVLIDVSRRDPDRLLKNLVAARTPRGIEVVRIRRDGSLYMLVPLRDPSATKILRPNGEITIVGVIVKWIGEPAPIRK